MRIAYPFSAIVGQDGMKIALILTSVDPSIGGVLVFGDRGTGAEVLLPPTRSLVQTKRRLASLPGGGGTPLAAGLAAGFALAEAARRRGMTPAIAILSDGHANVALDGRPDRPAAEADASQIARRIRALGLTSVVIDTGNRPGPHMKALADTLGAALVPLPRADARRIGAVVAAAV